MITPIQATISGYSGKPCTLFAGYDMDSRILSVQVDKPFMIERWKNCVVISNQTDIERDVLFSEDDLSDAIRCFYEMNSGVATDGKSQRLYFADAVARSRPDASVQKDKMDMSGQKYQVSETISCLQVAALATCWYAHGKLETINATVDFTQRMNELWQASTGCIITV